MALPRRSRGQTRTTRGVNDPPRRATGVSRVLACCVGAPVVSHRCFTLPRSSILCGCINIPGRQVNAVWGRCPTACTMYIKREKAWSVLGLVDKISPAFEFSVGLALLNRISQRRCNASRREAGEGRGGLSGQTGRQSPRPTPVPEAPAPR
jgi:hypothetical protein